MWLTICMACGYRHPWYSYKWVDSKERRDWNRSRSTQCTRCESTDVVRSCDGFSTHEVWVGHGKELRRLSWSQMVAERARSGAEP